MRGLRALLLALVLLVPVLAVAEVPSLLLAEIYRDSVDVSAYLVSEKLDGVRAVWDGKTLRFRSGREVKAPDWFIAGLPATPLDGELWAGRGSFERLSGIVRKEAPVDAEWRDVRYMVFELPDAPGSFAERAETIKRTVQAAKVLWLQAIEQNPAVDRQNLQKIFKAVLRAGGEGVMLHRADAPYVTGRSDVLLKVKPWLDAEAEVVAHLPGKGRHTGRLGALRVRLPDGREFSLGSGFTDAQRDNPPPVGSTVTYRYRDLTASGLPRFASFLRVRAAE
jgi:DNA ligase-1